MLNSWKSKGKITEDVNHYSNIFARSWPEQSELILHHIRTSRTHAAYYKKNKSLLDSGNHKVIESLVILVKPIFIIELNGLNINFNLLILFTKYLFSGKNCIVALIALSYLLNTSKSLQEYNELKQKEIFKNKPKRFKIDENSSAPQKETFEPPKTPSAPQKGTSEPPKTPSAPQKTAPVNTDEFFSPDNLYRYFIYQIEVNFFSSKHYFCNHYINNKILTLHR